MPENKILLGEVVSEVRLGVGTITFSHPAQNAFPSQQLQRLVEAIEQLGMDEAAKVIILQSAGDRTFCAGASFDELAAIQNFEQGKQFFMGFAKVINALRKCPKFVIGRVQGKAVGGGVGLCAAVDYCIASKWASVKLSELAIGIGPFVVGPAVERKMGTAAMSHLAINATEWQTAEWAKQKGLFNEVFETVEQVDAYVADLAGRLAAFSPEAMKQLKQACWQGTEHWDLLLEERAAISGQLVLSDFTRKAIAQFKQKDA
ncbi:MAG TPA: enoyl-CoA hydratase/isomerase family protein [Saprospiraceae bacterium]|nr:enoyl-CoA hydratase/isomerase family protein [Saprospiraceae bacterium]HMQ85400.1 enoyl-CoA hydratase/isomerase family protein [Saprospiraceae bacterium]